MYPYTVNERVETTDGYLGTVRYVGTVPAWGEELALGIEWDQANRGKNDGSLNGVRYFQTLVANAGSFVKANSKKLLSKRYTFAEAMSYQYGGLYEEEEEGHEQVSFGTKVVESYGFGKLTDIQKNFYNLKVVSLQRGKVYGACRDSQTPYDDSSDFYRSLQNVRSLDLGFNLFPNLQEVWNIVDRLDQLESLTLNGNRFETSNFEQSLTCHFALKELHLTSTNLHAEELPYILRKFPNLQVLSLGANRYTDEDLQGIKPPDSLKAVDLCFNLLTNIPIWARKIYNVNLSDNRISRFELSTNRMFDTRTTHLNLKNNLISQWEVIDSLQTEFFPHLYELRINGNPLFNEILEDDMIVNLIGRLLCTSMANSVDKIYKINGASLNEGEINNLELYFISKAKSGEFIVDFTSERWKSLVRQYNIAMDEGTATKVDTLLRKSVINLNLVIRNKPFQRQFVRTNTVLKLKGIVARLKQVSVLRVRASYCMNEEELEEERVNREMDDNLAILDFYDLQEGQNVYIYIEDI